MNKITCNVILVPIFEWVRNTRLLVCCLFSYYLSKNLVTLQRGHCGKNFTIQYISCILHITFCKYILTITLFKIHIICCVIHITYYNPVGFRLKVKGKGQSCVAVWYLTPLLGYFIFPHVWLVGVMPCPRKSQKELYKRRQ